MVGATKGLYNEYDIIDQYILFLYLQSEKIYLKD